MNRKVQDLGITPEHVLGTIAMMYIPVYYQQLLHS
jgi:hypothetical protein